jgi:peptide/nickel transport system substrate-binding protein
MLNNIITGRGLIVLALVGMTASLAAFSGSASAGPAQPGKIVVGDQSIATAVDPDGPAATNPQNLDVENNAYEGLTNYKWKPNAASLGGGNMLDASGMAPGLATSWKLTPKKVTFALRKGVKNSYGHEFTSADVKYTYDRNMALNAVGKFILTVNGRVTGITTEGKYKFSYITSGPAPVMLAAFASAYAKPVDSIEVKKHATKKDPWATKWLANHTAGWGPYDLTTFTPGKEVVLTPSKTYWDGAPQNAIRMLPIPDSSSRLDAVKKGDINLAVGLTPQQDKNASGDSSLHQFRFNGNVVLNLYPNEKQVKPVKNKLVRQAMHYAIPVDQIISQVYLGYAFNPKSIIPPYLKGFTSKYWPYTYDPAKAKALMKQAGYSNGFNMDIWYASESASLAQVAPIVQAALGQIGIKVTLRTQPQAQILTRVFGKRDMDSFFVDLAANVPPALANVAGIWQTGLFGNDTFYSSKAFDKAAQAASNTYSVNAPADLAMQKILADDPPTVSMVGLQTVVTASKNVNNYSWTPEGSIAFKTLTVGSS